jgi:twitching motility protein PilT
MVDIINSKRRRNIITIEDPIEYLHRHKESNVNQREVGLDTRSFHEGLRHVFREAPDVIMIGEMRDRESIAIALEAADTGHLVMSSMHANNAVMAINRIVDVFPAESQQQVRVQLADNLLLVLNQRLVERKDGQGRLLAFEKLANSYRVANLLREGKEHQIRAQLQSGAEEFSSLDSHLAQLVRSGKITRDTALHYCQDSKVLQDLLTRPGR